MMRIYTVICLISAFIAPYTPPVCGIPLIPPYIDLSVVYKRVRGSQVILRRSTLPLRCAFQLMVKALVTLTASCYHSFTRLLRRAVNNTTSSDLLSVLHPLSTLR